MTKARNSRSSKKQLGQFLTPFNLSKSILSQIQFKPTDKVLEPSFGDGSFVIAIIDKFLELGLTLEEILQNNLYGVEIDETLYNKTLDLIRESYGSLPPHNLYHKDFFEYHPTIKFNYIIGNPPFGGTILYHYQDELDKIYGKRNGYKIKKETYSFFLIKSTDLLQDSGKIIFICSDTFLTIKTMEGLRRYLFATGHSKITSIDVFSDETNYPMIIIDYEKDTTKDFIIVDEIKITEELMNLTKNFSWSINKEYAKYFQGEVLGDYIVASGGLSTGKNEYFVREIKDNMITESYNFEFFQDPITLEKEIEKARLNKLSDNKRKEIEEQEFLGKTKRNVKITECEPYEIELPHEDYLYYNRATRDILYSEPTHVIYWKDDGDAVLTFKRNGNWYLHGVGGAPFFKKESLTWQLIAKKINCRYLPEGYILDNSAPVAVLKDGIEHDELYFIIGWLLTSYATDIQKKVINHTKNIQNKDIERLPYPTWVKDKQKCIDFIKKSIEDKKLGKLESDFQEKVDKLYKL